MKTILIIAVLLVLLFLYSRRNRKIASDPIKTIFFGSCMGFKLGDSKKFVLSRIRHLKLMNKEETEHYNLEEQMGLGTLSNRRISTSDSLFNNIEGITFTITTNRLSNIHISLKPEQVDKQTLMNIIEKRISTNIGNPIFNSVWKNGNRVVVLEKDDMYINIS